MMIAIWKCSFFPFPPPSVIPLIKKNRDKINTSQATTGIIVVFCEVLWELSPMLRPTVNLQVMVLSGKKLRALGSGKYLAHSGNGERIGNEEVTGHSAGPGLGPVFIFILFSFCFSFSHAFVIYTNEQMLLIFSSLSILLRHWSQVMECLWPSLRHHSTSNKSKQMQALV